MFGRLADGLGLSYREIRRMRVRDVQRQFRFWSKHPPVREMVAAYLGIGVETKADLPKSESDFLAAIASHGSVTSG